jgi:hypothetical protein
LLRTPEGSSGRQTQCPECGEMLTVPQAGPSPSPFAAPPQSEANPYQSPAAALGQQQAAPGEVVRTPIELGDVLARGWAIFQSQFGMVVLGVFLAGVLTNAPQWLANIVIQLATFAQLDPVLIVALQVVFSLGIWAFQIWVTFGELAYLLHIARGGRPEISMLFTGSRYFLPGLSATLLFVLMFVPVVLVCFGPAGAIYAATNDEDQTLVAALVGLPVFSIVAVWLSLTFSYYQLAIVDRQCGPLESLAMSRTMTSGNKLTLLGLFLIMMMINIAGFLACCIGAVFTGAFSMLTAFPVVWLCMTGQPTGDQYLLPPSPGPIAAGPAPVAPDADLPPDNSPGA